MGIRGIIRRSSVAKGIFQSSMIRPKQRGRSKTSVSTERYHAPKRDVEREGVCIVNERLSIEDVILVPRGMPVSKRNTIEYEES
jgi:hypothetical protein